MFTTCNRLRQVDRNAPSMHVIAIQLTLLLMVTFAYPISLWACQASVTGGFVQLNTSLANKSASWWQAELNAMADVGMDTLIVQYVAIDNNYFYPTSIAGGTPFGTDSLERILDAADSKGVEVYLGMHLDSGPNNSGTFDLGANLTQGQSTLSELANRYGNHASLAGWYNPQEFSDYIALDSSQAQLRDNLTTYIHDLAEVGRSLSGLGLPTMISPYFGQNPNPQLYAQWWDVSGLPAMGVDIVAMQDGVGTHRTTIGQSQAVFQAIEPVMASHGVDFWANNESFNQIHGWPVDGQAFQAVPTHISTFVDQIEATAPLTSKSVTFEFSHYMSPQGGGAAQALYADYRNHYQLTGSHQIPVSSYTYDNSPTASFHPSANDPQLSLLTDGDMGSLADGPGSAFANGSWVGVGDDGPTGGPQPRIILDLGGEHSVDFVEMTYLVDASAYIFAPQETTGIADALTIEVSTNGTDFTTEASTNDFISWTSDQASGAFVQRTVRVDLGGVSASYLGVDVRTPNTWIFLGEIRVFQVGDAADFNGDGMVDGDDLFLWQSHYASSSSCGDADSDGDVDGADFLIWQRQLSNPSGANYGSVPEPSTTCLLCLPAGLLCLGMRVRLSL